ncbi:hypothetical protein [Pararcticibacter amylolyticus]|uniref:Uncharacterized protein n=1 Tax=Pararcticibacter amylolyticus TaxID=2173175 RepID=A0A2U2PC23_9SPHI|nr:hypothetical protein [Pararcticibacter amylolyticus]PWG78951.1 hypothetical protein DDR33_20080 [Pararcticibacter amylolyticus]
MKYTISYFLLFIGVLLLSCSSKGEDEHLRQRFEKDVSAQYILLDKLTDYGWDQIYVIAPYTHEKQLDQTLLKNRDLIEKSMIPVSDNFYLLVLTRNEKVAGYAKISATAGSSISSPLFNKGLVRAYTPQDTLYLKKNKTK